ncbi:MAG: recombinase family protein [Alphaproteobacteria bacterium]|nr:recombinase family protein [Alphaproteobacteria bacterium]
MTSTLKVALYARYSSDQQSEASIEDQLRVCRIYAEKQGWSVIDSYSDRAISGASLLRPGIQELIADAGKGRFQVILAEALDRLSRDQEDIAGLHKRASFAGVKLVTLSEGEITHLHIGLKGTMNALFLQDLADKTRRGLRGRVEQGKSGGGLCYGYDAVRKIDGRGEPVRGERRINQTEAEVVRRIFSEFVAGKSPRAIARQLNADNISGPRGRVWMDTAIRGHASRGNGILNNELYIGRLVWNRQRFLKDPDTGRRVSRPNPRQDWVIHEVPELRIVEQELWESVKSRQATIKVDWNGRGQNQFRDRRRPRHLFSGMIKCGTCGGGYAMTSSHRMGCSTRRNKGTCNNAHTIPRETVEKRVLAALQDRLMDAALFKEFCTEFTRAVNGARNAQSAALEGARNELTRIERQIGSLIEAIKDGLYQPSMKAELDNLEARKAQLIDQQARAQVPPPLLHPNMAELYREKVSELHAALNSDDRRTEAADILRTLISAIVLTPNDGKLAIRLSGDLGGILALSTKNERPSQLTPEDLLQFEVVAGAGFEPATFRL